MTQTLSLASGDDAAPAATGRARQLFTLAQVYTVGLGSMAMVGMLSPLIPQASAAFHSPASAMGVTISLFSLPAAVVSALGGGLVDRLGSRRVLMLAPLLLALADAGLMLAHRLWLFDLAMLVAGLGYVGVLNGGAAMLMTALRGSLRARGLALWSSYAPAGFSVGLLLAAGVAQWANWRLAFGLHGLVMLVCAAGSLALPRMARLAQRPAEAREPAWQRWRRLANPHVLFIALASALPNMISYGTSLVATGYLARTQGVSLAASASIVASAKIIAVLTGSTVTGALLTRRVAPVRLYIGMAAVGALAQLALFLPASPLVVAVGGLMAWIFAFGALSGICMALLPQVAARVGGAGAVAGMVNQFVSVASLLTPAIYFGICGWGGYWAVAAGGLAVGALTLRGATKAGGVDRLDQG